MRVLLLGLVVFAMAAVSLGSSGAAQQLPSGVAAAASDGLPTRRLYLPFARSVAEQASIVTNQETAVLGIYRPELPDNRTALTAYERAAGKRVGIIHWYAGWLPGSWKRDFSRADLDSVAGHGALPMISWGPEGGSLRETVLSGRNDAYIDSWARGLAAYGQPVLLRFGWEMHNQPAYDWAVGNLGNTPDDFVRAWKYVRARFVRLGATNVQWVWCPNSVWNVATSPYAALYPGDDQVEWLGLDTYNTGPTIDWGMPRWATFAEVIGPSYAAITAVSQKPIIVAEIGSTESPGDKAAWISDALGPDLARRFPRIKAVVWFDVRKELDWEIQSSPGATDAFIRALRSNRFGPSLLLLREQPAE